jgi:hypothetical protein
MSDDISTEETQVEDLEQFEKELSESYPATDDELDDADQGSIDDDGGEEPTPEGEGVEPAPEDEPAAEPEARLYSVPDHEKFGENRGQKLTAAQLEEAGLLEKFVTWEHQGLHANDVFQKNKELAERQEALEKQIAELQRSRETEEPTEPAPQPLTPEETKRLVTELQARHIPNYELAAANGGIEPELVEFAPKFLAVQEHRFQSGQEQLNIHRTLITALVEDLAERTQTTTTKSAADHLTGIMDSVLQSETFSGFQGEGIKDSFAEWFATDKNGRGYNQLPVNLVNEKIMEDAAMAFMRDNPDLFAAPRTKEEAPPASNDKRHLAGGGGHGRGGSPGSGSLNKFEQFEQELAASEAQ